MTKEYKTEWSFSFDKIGDQLNKMIGSFSDEQEVHMASFSEPISGAVRAVIDLDISVGESTIKALTASENLIEADVTFVGEMVFDASGTETRTITMKQKRNGNAVTSTMKKAFGAIANRDDLRWDVRLSPDVPLELDIDAGVGLVHADLTGLNLVSLSYDGGVGKHELILPSSDRRYAVEIDGGVGEVNVTLPENTDADIRIDGGVGAVRLHIPGGVAVRFKVESGLGSVNMPKYLIPLKSKDEIISKSGVWQTPDFENAPRQITVKYDGGVGAFSVTGEITPV